ncbi:MAG: hypothetical protein IJO93_06350 [Clostridia bacterium]|nr:hypothetical protein [Clostridia bacterium]
MYITENDIVINEKEDYARIKLAAGDRPWTGGINGKFYRISRGVPVDVPVNLAKLIRQNEEVTILSKRSVEEYKKPEGKCLGGKSK